MVFCLMYLTMISPMVRRNNENMDIPPLMKSSRCFSIIVFPLLIWLSIRTRFFWEARSWRDRSWSVMFVRDNEMCTSLLKATFPSLFTWSGWFLQCVMGNLTFEHCISWSHGNFIIIGARISPVLIAADVGALTWQTNGSLVEWKYHRPLPIWKGSGSKTDVLLTLQWSIVEDLTLNNSARQGNFDKSIEMGWNGHWTICDIRHDDFISSSLQRRIRSLIGL